MTKSDPGDVARWITITPSALAVSILTICIAGVAMGAISSASPVLKMSQWSLVVGLVLSMILLTQEPRIANYLNERGDGL